MDKLITVKDVSERYSCSLPTARKYIRQCNPHMEKPLATPEWAFREWENGRSVYKRAEKITKSEYGRLMARCEKVHVPRKREG